jgi:4-hydroxy-2-oxoheptanedioate aldolase
VEADRVWKFKQQMQHRPVFGPFCKTSDPGMIEVMGYAGFDFVILDMEHGPNHLETIQHLVRAAEVAGIIPIVRVPNKNEEMISKVLDIGAAGIQVPQVTTAQDVALALQAAKFAPLGRRGVCRYVRAAKYSATRKDTYFRQANDALLIIQLEGVESLRNLDEILNVRGPDVVFVGPYDLSQSLGVTGEVEHPLVVEKTREIVARCRDKNIVVGTFTETPAQAISWSAQGLRYISFSVDVGLMYQTCVNLVAELRRENSA